MKKVNILLVILTIAIVAVSCETYDDYNTDRKTVVGFVTPTRNISVPENMSKTDSVQVFISDISSSARTYTVTTVPVDTLPTGPENYTFESTVTFPANTRQVSFYVTAIDNTIDDTRRFFKLAIQGEADAVSGGRALIGVKN